MKIKIKHYETIVEIEEDKGVIHTCALIIQIIKETVAEIIKLKQ